MSFENTNFNHGHVQLSDKNGEKNECILELSPIEKQKTNSKSQNVQKMHNDKMSDFSTLMEAVNLMAQKRNLHNFSMDELEYFFTQSFKFLNMTVPNQTTQSNFKNTVPQNGASVQKGKKLLTRNAEPDNQLDQVPETRYSAPKRILVGGNSGNNRRQQESQIMCNRCQNNQFCDKRNSRFIHN